MDTPFLNATLPVSSVLRKAGPAIIQETTHRASYAALKSWKNSLSYGVKVILTSSLTLGMSELISCVSFTGDIAIGLFSSC